MPCIAVSICLGSTLASADESDPGFHERSRELGIDFVYEHFGTGEKYMPENMSPGVAVLDYDGDGRLDIYIPQGAPGSAQEIA